MCRLLVKSAISLHPTVQYTYTENLLYSTYELELYILYTVQCTVNIHNYACTVYKKVTKIYWNAKAQALTPGKRHTQAHTPHTPPHTHTRTVSLRPTQAIAEKACRGFKLSQSRPFIFE